MTMDDLEKAFLDARRKSNATLFQDGVRDGLEEVVKRLLNEVVLKIDAHRGIGIVATETAIDATRDVFEAVLGGTPCQSVEQRMPETTTKGEQR